MGRMCNIITADIHWIIIRLYKIGPNIPYTCDVFILNNFIILTCNIYENLTCGICFLYFLIMYGKPCEIIFLWIRNNIHENPFNTIAKRRIRYILLNSKFNYSFTWGWCWKASHTWQYSNTEHTLYMWTITYLLML